MYMSQLSERSVIKLMGSKSTILIESICQNLTESSGYIIENNSSIPEFFITYPIEPK